MAQSHVQSLAPSGVQSLVQYESQSLFQYWSQVFLYNKSRFNQRGNYPTDLKNEHKNDVLLQDQGQNLVSSTGIYASQSAVSLPLTLSKPWVKVDSKRYACFCLVMKQKILARYIEFTTYFI